MNDQIITCLETSLFVHNLDEKELLEDEDFKAMVEEQQYILPGEGHRLMLIQPGKYVNAAKRT